MKTQSFSKFAPRLFPRVVLVLCLAFTSQTTFAQSPNPLSEIEQLYNVRSYSQALTLVDQRLNANFMNSNLHYLKANILAAIGDLTQAVAEYQYALSYNPSPSVREYCNKALSALQKSNPSLAQTTTALDKQTRHEVRRTQKQTVATGQQIQAEANEYQQNHAARTNEIVNRMQNTGFYDHDGDWQPLYGPADINAVQARRQAKEASVVNQYQQSNMDAQNAGQQRASAVVDSAEGLKSQMSTPVKPGEAALDSSTSNLFVRNYSQPAGSAPAAVPSMPRPATVTVP